MPLLELAPRSFDEYVAAGGGAGLRVALGISPEVVIDRIAESGLRGRGGAGFPTGDKWRAIRVTGTGARFAVCNGAEGEPATFKDRSLLRTNPYQVLEGLAIAAYAIGAERAYLCVKEAFTQEVQAVDDALREMEGAGALGEIPIQVVLGPDLYLFGEETGLEEVIEGRPPLPRIARPYMLGLFAEPPNDDPTLVNNVETLANVPHILADGADWLRSSGTDASPGTMVFTVCGDVRREGVFELPLGTPLRHLVEDLAGGPPEGRSIKAIFPGASNTVLAPSELDTPMDFDSLRQVGSGLGAAGFAVFDESACMVKAAHLYSRFLAVESCGQCPACKFGTGQVTELLTQIEAEGASDELIEAVLMRARSSTDGQKCALPTGESLLIQSLVQVFLDEFQAHQGGDCPLPRDLVFHKIVDRDAAAERFIYDQRYANKQVDWTFTA
ncbi:MAG: NADH-ubiquinone oxidoreductase-F iron-sulfur binding region domain-containing protein [Solirubrobacterales bacterium]